MWETLEQFYNSSEWKELSTAVKLSRVDSNNDIICEYCNKPIYKKHDCIAHHKTILNMTNVNDTNISLNPNNIMVVHHKCHDEIHGRTGQYNRHIYLVYGSPLSGKTSWVKNLATKDDLVIDIDIIRASITGGALYERSHRLNDNVFAIRDILIDMVRYKRGRWIRAFIVGTYPYVGERERLASQLDAEVVLIEATKEECLERLEVCNDRDKVAWRGYIEDWFRLTGL